MISEPTPPTAEKKKPPLDKKLAAIGAGLFIAGLLVGQGGIGGGRMPWEPENKRPVLTAIARVAKLGLWLLVVEPVPEEFPDENQYVHNDLDRISHREGW